MVSQFISFNGHSIGRGMGIGRGRSSRVGMRSFEMRTTGIFGTFGIRIHTLGGGYKRQCGRQCGREGGEFGRSRRINGSCRRHKQ